MTSRINDPRPKANHGNVPTVLELVTASEKLIVPAPAGDHTGPDGITRSAVGIDHRLAPTDIDTTGEISEDRMARVNWQELGVNCGIELEGHRIALLAGHHIHVPCVSLLNSRD